MIDIEFAGHADLWHILRPVDWQGHPRRKDYSIRVQDQLGIESGQ